MNILKSTLVGITLLACAGMAQAEDMTKEEAIAASLILHPGTVEKAYQETKKGVLLWEVKIVDEDGIKWEVFHSVADGEFVMEEKDD